jgi:general secretion pathway protein J
MPVRPPATTEDRASREHGFTLLEVLIAMTLLGLIMMLLFGGLRLGTRAWETNSDRVEEISQIEISHQVIRRMLAQAYPLVDRDAISDLTDGRGIEFAGEPESVAFAGLMPAHLGGGFHRFQLLVDDDGGASRLVLRWRRITFGGDDDGAAGNEAILIERISSARFSYFGPAEDDDVADWHEAWDNPASLPALVRLEIDFPDGDRRFWPDLVVAPRIDAIDARMP